MSVPLDRLYHHMRDLVNRDIIIYRWNPHGSKNLKDITVLDPVHIDHWLTTPIMFCHDQEPLDYNYYTEDMFRELSKATDPVRAKLVEHPDAFSSVFKPNLRYLSWDNLYDSVFLTHSEMHSSQVAVYQENNFLPIYIWSHGLMARDWFRYAEYDRQLNQPTSHAPYDFLIYNRAWQGTREYRLKLLELILNNGLEKHCNVRFTPVDTGTHYRNHIFKNNKLSITRYDFEQILPLNTHDSNSSADYNHRDYLDCKIEVVLETLFDDDRWHLTEKSLRPIACGKPFILAATTSSLKYLQQYGFETFNGLIDESYDSIVDPSERLHAIVQEMKRISLLPVSQKENLCQQLNSIATRNKERFFSDSFYNQIVTEYTTNFQIANEIMNTKGLAKHWQQMYQFVENHCPDLLEKIFSPDEHIKVASWLRNQQLL
jgi:hypothetical protein